MCDKIVKLLLSTVLAAMLVPITAFADTTNEEKRFASNDAVVPGQNAPLYSVEQFEGLTEAEINEIIGKPDEATLGFTWDRSSGSDPTLSLLSLGEGTASDMVDIVESQPAGVPEGGDCNKYNKYSGEPWCAYFIAWCARQAGVDASVVPDIYECTRLERFYRNQGAWHSASYTPKAGDIIFYSTSSNGSSCHVGVVVKVENGYVYTKEGNNTGGKVAVHERPVGASWIWYGWYVKGYASPNYATHKHSFSATSRPYNDCQHYSTFGPCVCGAQRSDGLQECAYLWSGLSLVCKGCGQEYVPHAAGEYVVVESEAALYESDDSSSRVLASIPKDTVLDVGNARLDASGRYMAAVAYGGTTGYVRLDSLMPNGSAGVHDYKNGACQSCFVPKVASQPGIYTAETDVVLYKGNVLDSSQKIVQEGEAIIVSNVGATTYGWLWGMTPDGYVLDMGDLSSRISDVRIQRACGNTASETATAISLTTFNEAECIVIARNDDFADAMSATGLAGVLECPILLVDRTGVSPEVAEEIQRLGATKAYIIGGTGALSPTVEDELAAAGIDQSERVWGESCWDTSVECANMIVELGGSSNEVIVAMSMNFQDALSMSSFAYAYKVPILLQTDDNHGRCLTDEAREFVGKEGTIYVPGGFGAVSYGSVEGVFGEERVIRLWGWDGYDTSNQIATYMVENGLLSADVVTIACGAEAAKGSDALSGAALAGKNGGVILLANSNERMESTRLATIEGSDSQGDPAFLSAHADGVSRAYVLGGAYVMPEGLVARIGSILT